MSILHMIESHYTKKVKELEDAYDSAVLCGGFNSKYGTCDFISKRLLAAGDALQRVKSIENHFSHVA